MAGMKTLGDISLAETDRQAVLRAADVLRSRFPIAGVILYGSKARGDDAAGSDIDLLVLTDRPVTYREKEEMTRAVYPLELELAVVISLLIMDEQKWKTGLCRAMPIHAEVERDGVAA
jgi:predicted nucleotidyltransferase